MFGSFLYHQELVTVLVLNTERQAAICLYSLSSIPKSQVLLLKHLSRSIVFP